MATKRMIRGLIVYIAKLVGAFSTRHWITRGDFRILCYHGAALEDGHALRPMRFITERKYEQRLKYLSERLDEALRQRQENRIPPYATVVTIDDGWFGAYSEMAPLLRSFSFLATLCVSIYYMGPNEHDLAKHEIEENLAALTGLAIGELAHFRYPSGEHSKGQIPRLEALGIASATNTETGINRKQQLLYELLRTLERMLFLPHTTHATADRACVIGYSRRIRRSD